MQYTYILFSTNHVSQNSLIFALGNICWTCLSSPGWFTYKKQFWIVKGHWCSLVWWGLNGELMLPSAVTLDSKDPISLAALVAMLWLLWRSKDTAKAFLKLISFSSEKQTNKTQMKSVEDRRHKLFLWSKTEAENIFFRLGEKLIYWKLFFLQP